MQLKNEWEENLPEQSASENGSCYWSGFRLLYRTRQLSNCSPPIDMPRMARVTF